MKVILINPMAKSNREPATFPLGLLSIASHLKRCGHEVKILDRTSKATSYKKVIKKFAPDMVGISFLSIKSTKDAIKISNYSHSLGIPVIYGNTLASAVADILLLDGYADYVALGEGEFVFEELLEALENKKKVENIPGLALLKDGKTYYTEPRPFADGSALPVIDWSFVDPVSYARPSYECKKMVFVYSSKGCPARCSFCFNETFHKRMRRARPLEDVLTEICDLVENYGVDGFFFGDELWSVGKKELYEKCRALKELELPFVWGCHLRVGLFEQEDYEYMYECGCRWIFFGVETGSPKILKQINKGTDTDGIIKAHREAHAAGIALLPSFILGFPDEQEEDLRKTVSLIKKIAPYSNPKAFYLSPLIGTQLYSELVEGNLLDEIYSLKQLDAQWNKMGHNFSDVPRKDIKIIYSHIVWWSITNRSPVTMERKRKKIGFSHPANALLAVLKSIPQNGVRRVIPNLLYSATEFLKIIYYISFFKKIKKKYVLHKTESADV